jgi:alkyl sulfatase BDS1-like metallo-beta-lactamase superfamily hydrolase
MKLRLGALYITIALTGCGEQSEPVDRTVAALSGSDALVAHSQVFEQRIENPAPGVYVAIGYALANSIWIDGDEGAIVVDTTESRGAAEAVLQEFRRYSDKPVKAIVYTHNHADHIMGASVFAAENDVQIVSHKTLPKHVARVSNVLLPTIETNAMRMFGERLAEGGEAIINDGIGPELKQIAAQDGLGSRGYLPPNQTFDDRLDLEIEGVKLSLIHAPGETDDQIVVWLPELGVLLPGDNVYKAFPNLYTIRGTPYRDVRKWSESVRAMAKLKPRVMVPSHTESVVGEKNISALLTDYADAIQFVHDQTIRLINEGLRPDDIVEQIQLPQNLAEHPWLQPFYGTVEWAARSVYAGYLGWFDGDSVDLFPTPKQTKATRLIELMGGAEVVLNEASAQLNQDPQWAAELAAYVLTADSSNTHGRAIKAAALRAMAEAAINPNARNWYLSEALELERKVAFEPRPTDAERLVYAQTFPIENILELMTVSLNPAKSAGVNTSVEFVFPDQSKRFLLTVRNQILLIDRLHEPKAGAVRVTVNASDWVALVTQHDSLPAALASGRVATDGVSDLPALLKFLAMFTD